MYRVTKYKRATAALRHLAIAVAIAFPSFAAHADQLIDNVDGWTVDANGKAMRFNGLVIDEDGRVKSLLQPRDKRPKDKYLTLAYDAEGKTMLPGLVDGGIDMSAFMEASLGLDLGGVRDPADAFQRLSAFAADNEGRHWLVGRGWDDLSSMPAADAIESISPDRPMILFDRGDSRAIANARALQLLDLQADGLLEGESLQQAKTRMPALRAADRDIAFDAAQHHLLSSGITGLSDLGSRIEDWQAYRRAGDGGRLQLRISSYAADIGQMELIAGSRPTTWLYDDKLRLSGLYLPIDGAPESGNIWQQGAPAPVGNAFSSDSKLRNSMVRAAMDGFSVAIGAYGSAAIDEAMAALAELSVTYGNSQIWRVIGPSAPLPQSAPGITLTMRAELHQPGMLHADASIAPIGSVANYGAFLTAASLPRRTILPAYAGEMGKFSGELTPGKWADFILLNPVEDGAVGTYSTDVAQTWVGGKLVWRKPPF